MPPDLPEDPQEEFSAAFSEATAPAPAPTPTPSEPPAPPTPPAPEPPPAPGEATPPAPAPTEAPAPPGEAPAPKPPTVEELQAQVAELQHQNRSHAGRASAAARREAELLRELETVRSRASAPAAPTPPAQKAPAPTGPKLEDVLKEAPDLRAAIEARIAEAVGPVQAALDKANERLQAVGQTVEQAVATVQPLAKRDHEQETARVVTELTSMFGEAWKAEVQGERFQDWLGQQEQQVQDLYRTSRTTKGAAAVLRLYVADTGAAHLKPATTPPPSPTPPAPANSGGAPATPATRLRNAGGIPTRTGARPPAQPDPNDFHAAFAEAVSAGAPRK